jgi:hypothetical protein
MKIFWKNLKETQKKLAQYNQKWLHHDSKVENIIYPNNSLTINLSKEKVDDH